MDKQKLLDQGRHAIRSEIVAYGDEHADGPPTWCHVVAEDHDGRLATFQVFVRAPNGHAVRRKEAVSYELLDDTAFLPNFGRGLAETLVPMSIKGPERRGVKT